MRIMLMTMWRLLRTGSWTPLLGKALVWLGAFAALAHVGSGAAARLQRPGEAQLSGGAPAASAPSASAASAEGGGCGAGGGAVGAKGCGEPSGGKAITADGRVILNLATSADLVRLPGIGPKRAAAILALRARLGGRFRRLADLLRVRGIGYRSLQRLRPRVVLDPPPPKAAPSAAPAPP